MAPSVVRHALKTIHLGHLILTVFFFLLSGKHQKAGLIFVRAGFITHIFMSLTNRGPCAANLLNWCDEQPTDAPWLYWPSEGV